MSIDLREFLEGVRSLGAALGDEDLVWVGRGVCPMLRVIIGGCEGPPGTAALH
jgi:hypothetical protein